MAERRIIACPIGNDVAARQIEDDARMNDRPAGADWGGVGTAAHFPPMTLILNEPRSGRLGSLSQRTISSTATLTASGISSHPLARPRTRYRMQVMPATP